MMRSLEEQMSPDDPGAFHEGLKELIPMKRYGTDQEVAKLALFLGSDESSYMTGAVYLVDGGFTAA
ncbi:MAG: SDR family oxidoreductase [Gemmatimonadetes bacterium]|nr:SDR family oxidoreductase [Gemmatimonadota bacterium]